MKVFEGLKKLARMNFKRRFRILMPQSRLTDSNCGYLLRSSLR
ncbi:MAG: hypothetical protein OEW93_02150 [Candidatus Bathyarchaeota archaeon]|jgi:hypothetical protein|nr:hypothetical protein [Candidatus Bathyarchaeota archaeon]MDH5791240.1 hypothetical protein [Candidatus Bathyarchaeota archaeon]